MIFVNEGLRSSAFVDPCSVIWDCDAFFNCWVLLRFLLTGFGEAGSEGRESLLVATRI
jgi:hypothetical protein